MNADLLQLSRAEAALARGDLEEAENLCGVLLSSASPPAEAFLIRGIVHHRRGCLEAALACLEEANIREPNSPQVHLWLSRTLKKLGRGAEALDYAVRANRYKASDPSILHQLGSCQMDCGQFASAAESFYDAIALDGSSPVLYYRLGLALSQVGDAGAAASAFRDCLRLDPTSDTVKAALAAAEDAIRSRKETDAQIAIDPAAAIQLAYAWQQLGKLEEALVPALAAVRGLPLVAESHVQLGAIYLDLCRYPEAIQAFRKALELDPQHVFAYRALAQALRRTGEFKEEADVLGQARRIDPQSTAIRKSLIEAHLALQQIETARLEAVAFVDEKPESLEARCVLAECHLVDHRFDLAEAQASKALGMEPQSGHDAFRLGTLLRTLGRMDEASQLMLKSIELEPHQGAAYALLAHLRKASEMDRPRITKMKELSVAASLAVAERADLHYGLGRCHEDLNEYEAAMSHFDEANRLTYLDRFGTAKFDPEKLGSFLDRLTATLESKFELDSKNFGLESNLPVLVFGMIRSGTTLADQILSSHHDIGSVGEDPFWANHVAPFLGEGPNGINRKLLREVGQKYVAHMQRNAVGKKRVVDKTPANYAYIPLIHMALPNAKFIHMVRDPADTCLSIYTTMNSVRTSWAHDKGSIAFAYRNYQKVMQRWKELLPPGTMMEVRYEDLATDPERVTREMIAFCGLSWDDACLRPESNVRSVLTPSAAQVRQGVYTSSVARWKHYEPWIPEFLELKSRSAAEARGNA